MTHEEYKEMLAPGSIGALCDADERVLLAHLSACAECRAEAEVLNELAASLARLAPPVAPPAELRARILASVGIAENGGVGSTSPAGA
ncbi:MAG: hypothetical protein ACRD68_02680, partial [Pyrinomonadaceae bacterium]